MFAKRNVTNSTIVHTSKFPSISRMSKQAPLVHSEDQCYSTLPYFLYTFGVPELAPHRIAVGLKLVALRLAFMLFSSKPFVLISKSLPEIEATEHCFQTTIQYTNKTLIQILWGSC